MDLFDTAGAAGLHRHGPAERELFYYSALLHDIGKFLNYSDHHQHNAYKTRNADLLGFDQSEIALMAAVTRFHRKGRPKARDSALTDLESSARKAARVLSALLRIAEYRSQAGTSSARGS